MEPESWASASGVLSLGALGVRVVLIVSLSAMLFMFPFENSSVSSFIPDDRNCASGAMVKAASGVASLLRVAGRSVASFTTPLFVSLGFF